MIVSKRLVALVAVVSLVLGFAAGWAWRRHTHPSAQERFDRASRDFRKGLLGE